MAHQIHEISGVMHTIAFADGALEAKHARESSHKPFFKGAWSEEKAKRASNGATRAIKRSRIGAHQGRLWMKTVRFLIKMDEVAFQNHACHSSEKHFFANFCKNNRKRVSKAIKGDAKH